jgi:hypothetical protein
VGADPMETTVNRPTRKTNHLQDKIASKLGRTAGKKPGKRAKRWQKAIETHKQVAATPTE